MKIEAKKTLNELFKDFYVSKIESLIPDVYYYGWENASPVTKLHKSLYDIPADVEAEYVLGHKGEFIWREIDN